MIRENIKEALVVAMKAKDSERVSALRLIQAAIQNRDIEMRTAAGSSDDDVVVSEVLTKMAKQRRESIEMFDTGGRTELANKERAELAVIEGFLPQQMDEAEALDVVRGIVAEVGATSLKDMGKVMAVAKERLAGRFDMSKASALVKAALA